MANQPALKSALDQAASQIPPEARICNMDFIRFKEIATYEDHPDLNSPQLSGHEVFVQRYLPTLQAIIEEMGLGKEVWPVFQGASVATIIGHPNAEDGDKWDAIVITTFPSLKSYRMFRESEEYKTRAHHHRVAAMEKHMLFATVEVPTGKSEENDVERM